MPQAQYVQFIITSKSILKQIATIDMSAVFIWQKTVKQSWAWRKVLVQQYAGLYQTPKSELFMSAISYEQYAAY